MFACGVKLLEVVPPLAEHAALSVSIYLHDFIPSGSPPPEGAAGGCVLATS
jgi:hypothetical protein